LPIEVLLARIVQTPGNYLAGRRTVTPNGPENGDSSLRDDTLPSPSPSSSSSSASFSSSPSSSTTTTATTVTSSSSSSLSSSYTSSATSSSSLPFAPNDSSIASPSSFSFLPKVASFSSSVSTVSLPSSTFASSSSPFSHPNSSSKAQFALDFSRLYDADDPIASLYSQNTRPALDEPLNRPDTSWLFSTPWSSHAPRPRLETASSFSSQRPTALLCQLCSADGLPLLLVSFSAFVDVFLFVLRVVNRN
jgi:hypothetical protein